MRTRARVDANHAAVVDTFRQFGASVHSSSGIGGGFPDLVVGYSGEYVWLVEVKDGTKPPSARTLTPDQRSFHELWRGSPIRIVQSLDDVERLIQRSRTYAGGSL